MKRGYLQSNRKLRFFLKIPLLKNGLFIFKHFSKNYCSLAYNVDVRRGGLCDVADDETDKDNVGECCVDPSKISNHMKTM